jgi:L-asparaginase/Glu-tRNA(Gln) amidotransferase subunit D
MVLHGSGAPEIAQQSFNIQQRALEAGIPVYATTRRAARTLNKFIQYYEARSSRGIGDS